MIEEVIILFDKDGFLRSLLENVNRKLAALGARRVFHRAAPGTGSSKRTLPQARFSRYDAPEDRDRPAKMAHVRGIIL